MTSYPEAHVHLTTLTLAVVLTISPAALRAQADSLDVIIRHGRIIDGTGSPWYGGDIGIRAGRIAALGRLDSVAARQSIDADGQVVAPGFIDMLGQSEL